MGVKNLWDVLESCKKTVPLHHLQNKRVCVDLSCWMVQLHSVSKSHACVKEKVYLRGLFHRLRALIALNCSLIFVSDGAIPAIKLSTYRRRLNVGKEVQVAQNETNLQKATSLQRNMGSEFSCMIKEAKVLGMALGISCLNGNQGTCDLQIALSLLLGSDYYQGVHGLGPESACQIVKSIGDKYILKKFASEGLGWVKKRKDGYILPNIAERNLRRFANLRLTSSEVGLNLPLHEIPVKCPVSEIIKSRRVQGRECYEVSWEGMDGLETSIVPADLIESACREKILEFEERKAQQKKQNIQKRKPKKKETNSSVAELDLKLQNLLLDINLRDEANFNASDSSGRISRITTDMAEADLNTTDLLPLSHDIEHTGLIQNTSSEVVSSIDKNEIIDLLSPSPPKKSNLSSKCQQSSDQHIEVINLSDSENDMSVEHKQKAKELRLFLASIRNEIH
ncbi:hypothetical protein JHK85_046387 [Glycine max]|nr:hypothetical protein JHK85_046387 [Glycine max]